MGGFQAGANDGSQFGSARLHCVPGLTLFFGAVCVRKFLRAAARESRSRRLHYPPDFVAGRISITDSSTTDSAVLRPAHYRSAFRTSVFSQTIATRLMPVGVSAAKRPSVATIPCAFRNSYHC